MARGRLLSAADVAHCEHRVALDRGAPGAPTPAAERPEIARRTQESDDVRSRTVAALARLHPDAVIADGPEATERATREGVPLVLRARLADLGAARRQMAVDALVRVSGESPRYAPLIAKNNEVIEPSSARRVLEGTLTRPGPDEASSLEGYGIRRNATMTRNTIALAHATRVLETFGIADPQRRGGVVDRRGRLFWFDLAGPDAGRGALSTYDQAHELRRQVLEGHDRWIAGEGPFPTRPYWHRECPTCPYAARCAGELEAADDVSLVHFTNLSEQLLLREHGIATRVDLARLDPVLAAGARGRLLEPGVDHEAELHLGRVIDKLDELIYRARSAVAAAPLLKVTPGEVGCPTADVEVDVDMESYHERTYLWGALVRCRRPVAGVEEGYVSFVRFDRLDDAVEAEIFSDFWRWFSRLREAAERAGASTRAYCFWAQAEDAAMDRAVAVAADPAALRELVVAFRDPAGGRWIDVHEVAKAQVQTDGPLGLKSLARTAGFEWRDAHPSGEASMAWYEEARGTGPGAEAARRRLLEYNEDDCRATAALRDWLNGPARRLASRDTPPGGPSGAA